MNRVRTRPVMHSPSRSLWPYPVHMGTCLSSACFCHSCSHYGRIWSRENNMRTRNHLKRFRNKKKRKVWFWEWVKSRNPLCVINIICRELWSKDHNSYRNCFGIEPNLFWFLFNKWKKWFKNNKAICENQFQQNRNFNKILSFWLRIIHFINTLAWWL